MRRWLAPMPGIAALYLLNRATLGLDTGTALHTLRAWYFADVLAGALILCVANALLCWGNTHDPCIRPIRGVLSVSALALGVGAFWEFVTPLYLARSVSDPWDLLAYWLGNLLCLGLTEYWNHKKSG